MSPPRNPAHDEAVRLREEEGLSYKEISKRLGVPSGRVAWWCTLDGADPPGPPPRRTWYRAAGVIIVAGIPRRAVTQAEDAIIRDMRAAGASMSQIGRKIGRSPTVVRYRLAVMARDEARAEYAA